MGTSVARTVVGLLAGVLVAYGIVEVAVQLTGSLASSPAAAIAGGAPPPSPASVPQWLESPPAFKALPFAPPTGSAAQPAAPAAQAPPPAAHPTAQPTAAPAPAPHHKRP